MTSNFLARLFAAAIFAFGVSNASAGCAPNELESVAPSIDPGPITATTVEGRVVSFNVGDTSYQLVRDPATKTIIGLRAPNGQIYPLGSFGSDAPQTENKNSGKNAVDFDPCGIGGDSFTLDVATLPPVEVTGTSAPQPEFWVPVLTPVFPSDAELTSGSNGGADLEERFKRCKDKKDACMSKVGSVGLVAGATLCIKVADDIKTKKPKWGIIAILAGGACQVAADYITDKVKKKCEDEELVCRSTP
ncbi:hypothetical protein J2X20_005524 [Pelomonas saccharophila]|uniref:Uncharacterized protein n=1 Tax=Roseateles saccharophilus TaxID=304 RepID=A0ABU1YVE6_ROSSA|nr:hypothetical protein [Roseateles saccharophilus]MDR7272839.1 hypothetical protein [Roseateles saccharophilus]